MTMTIRAGHKLRIPFVINIRAMTPSERSDMIDLLQEKLGVMFFRDKGLLLAVIDDKLAQATHPRSFLAGPFLGVIPNAKGQLRVTSLDKESDHAGPGGITVYAADQVVALLDRIERDGMIIRWPDNVQFEESEHSTPIVRQTPS